MEQVVKNMNLIPDVDRTSWTNWLVDVDSKLKALGFRKYDQHQRGEDFCYWKSYYDGVDNTDDNKIYQIGLRFYDFRKYGHTDPNIHRVGVQFDCMLLNIDSRVDFTVSKDITLDEFEEMAFAFYNSMKKFNVTIPAYEQ